MAGWRVLLDLLRPGGFMRLGLYSEVGRRDVVAARSFIAEKGFAPTPDDIRRCRADLLASDLAGIARYYDFFNTSECRDLLFHVQEHRLTLPAIASFLAGHGLTLIGFDVAPPVVQAFRAKFPSDRSLGNIEHWHRFETDYPDAFSGMYQFWVQKS